MSAPTLVSAETMSAIQGAAVVFGITFLMGCVIGRLAWFLWQHRPKKRNSAETLGQMLLDEFKGDYRMAWTEVCRIKAEREMLERIAAQQADSRGRIVFVEGTWRLQ